MAGGWRAVVSALMLCVALGSGMANAQDCPPLALSMVLPEEAEDAATREYLQGLLDSIATEPCDSMSDSAREELRSHEPPQGE